MKKTIAALYFTCVCMSCFVNDIKLYEAEQAAKRNNPQRAIALYQSVDENLEDPVIAYNCAVLYAELKEYQAALNVYEKLLKKDIPQRIRIAALYNAAHILFEKKHYADAIVLLREALLITQDEAVLMLYQCSLTQLDPGTGVSALTEMSGVIGAHEAKTEALLFTPVPYGILFPGENTTSEQVMDY